MAVAVATLISASTAQVEIYSQGGWDSGTTPSPWRNFNVDDQGNRYFTAFSDLGTYKLSAGVITRLDFSVTGVSSDGTVFGGKRVSVGYYDAGTLGPSGEQNMLGWNNVGTLPMLWEGDYKIIDNKLFNGSTEIANAKGRTKLNNSGYSINNTSHFDSVGNETVITGSTAAIFNLPRTQTLDLTNSGKVLVGASSQPIGNPVGYSDPYSYSFAFLDIAKQDIVDIPVLPATYTSFMPSSGYSGWMSTSMQASANDQGDIVAAISKNQRQISNAEVWVFQSAIGWLNVTELTGLAPHFLETIDITNGGLIYGTYRNPNVGYSTGFAVQAPVPEPGTMLLLAAGVGALISSRRKKSV